MELDDILTNMVGYRIINFWFETDDLKKSNSFANEGCNKEPLKFDADRILGFSSHCSGLKFKIFRWVLYGTEYAFALYCLFGIFISPLWVLFCSS